MPFQKGHPGGPGRPKKIVEDAQHSILLQLFDEAAERQIVENMIRIAKRSAVDTAGHAIAAATWLWDRKYGKVKEPREHSGTVTFIVEYADPAAPDPPARGAAGDPQ